MKQLFIFLLLFHILPAVNAQLMHGRVVSEKDGKAIQGASIYINNSTTGTSSGEDGSFSLQSDNWANAELIISSVGYDPIVFVLDPKDVGTKNYLVKLTPRNPDLEAVLIINNEQRKRYLQLFRENFLGITAEGDASKITNQEAIYFVAGSGNQGSFIAKSDEPLQILNKRLGYKISFDLVEFNYDPVARTTAFYGYTRYESLGDNIKNVRRRAEAYYGSTMHFFRSLTSHDLLTQGFGLMQIRKQGNMDVAFVVADTVVFKKNKNDSSISELKFPDMLQVTYRFDPPGRKYLAGKNVLLPGGRTTQSRLQLRDATPAYIDNSGGLLNPEGIMVSGYRGYEKAASLLPANYVPDERYWKK